MDSHLLLGTPRRLLLVSTGNIGNRQMEALLASTLPEIVQEFARHTFLELHPNGIIVRG